MVSACMHELYIIWTSASLLGGNSYMFRMIAFSFALYCSLHMYKIIVY